MNTPDEEITAVEALLRGELPSGTHVRWAPNPGYCGLVVAVRACLSVKEYSVCWKIRGNEHTYWHLIHDLEVREEDQCT